MILILQVDTDIDLISLFFKLKSILSTCPVFSTKSWVPGLEETDWEVAVNGTVLQDTTQY